MVNARSLEAVHTHKLTNEKTNVKALVSVSCSKFNMLKTVK